eukprot:augustus_masked-scaffold_8-processed-gene-8.3-mRNA-1 protein AED:0.00 eAED:0.06 QI:0/-1/0/1/-1/1/1/0/418
MFITIIGGGNSTPIFATQCKLAGHTVAILTRRPSDWAVDNVVGFRNEDQSYLGGQEKFNAKIDLITSKYEDCIPQSDLIFISGVPIHYNEEILLKMKPFFKSNRASPVYIGSICSYGGFNWITTKVLGKGNYFVFGTQQIPWTCGTIKYGHEAVVFGQKANLRICTEVVGSSSNKMKYQEKTLLSALKDILQMENIFKTSFIVGTLWPNNPSVHPPILYGLFKDWDKNNKKAKFLFGTDEAPEYIYKDLTKQSADNIETLNLEVRRIIEKIPSDILLDDVEGCDYMNSLVYAYGSEGVKDQSTVQNAIRTTTAYLKHKNPYIFLDEETEGRKWVIPNVKHKFFTTDVSYGLCTYKDIALMSGIEVETPLIDEIIYWNQKLIDKEYMVDGQLIGKDIGECILPSQFGLTKESLGQGLRG